MVATPGSSGGSGSLTGVPNHQGIGYDVSGRSKTLDPRSGRFKASRCASFRLHGKYASTGAGARPPAAAHPVKYHRNHVRGLIAQLCKVATTENSNAANWPL